MSERDDVGSIVFLLRTLDTRPQLGVHVKTLQLNELDDSDADKVMERLHLMPNIKDLYLPWTVERRDLLLSLPTPDAARPRPRPTSLLLRMDDTYSRTNDWSLGPPSLGLLLDLSRLHDLTIESLPRPSVFAEEIGPLLPSSLSRLKLTNLPNLPNNEADDELIPYIAGSCPSLQKLVLGFEPPGWERHPPLPGLLETVLKSLPTLRSLAFEAARLEDIIGDARHPLLETLSLQTNEFEDSSSYPADHLLNTAVDDLCRLCQDPHAFPSLRLVRLSRCNPPFLRFKAGSNDYQQPGVVEMARMLKDVGLDLEDDYGYPWCDEWFNELEGGL
jgi:hypothetical protein